MLPGVRVLKCFSVLICDPGRSNDCSGILQIFSIWVNGHFTIHCDLFLKHQIVVTKTTLGRVRFL